MLDRIFPAATFTGANTFNVTLHLEIPAEKFQTLDQILTLCQSNQQELQTVNETMQRLTREVQETRESQASIITLIGGLAQQIRDNATDQAALNSLADSLDAGQAEIAAAVTANTATA